MRYWVGGAAVCAGRAAWRVYRNVLPRSDSEGVRDACRILDETILRSGDEQLIKAKLRYDLALGGRESRRTTESQPECS